MKEVVKTFILATLMILSGIFACGTLEAMAAGGITYGVGTILAILFVIVSGVCAYLLQLFTWQKKKPRKAATLTGQSKNTHTYDSTPNAACQWEGAK